MTADTYLNCVLTAISKLYHMLSIIVGTYFFGMMSILLVKTGSDTNPHFALKASAPPVCIANSSMCAVIPTCYNNSDFLFLATKYADDGLVFSTVSFHAELRLRIPRSARSCHDLFQHCRFSGIALALVIPFYASTNYRKLLPNTFSSELTTFWLETINLYSRGICPKHCFYPSPQQSSSSL